MVRFLLLFSFNEGITEIDILRIKSAFLIIHEKIPDIISVEWGENNSSENNNRKFSHCVNIVFSNLLARDCYLSHPEQIALKKLFQPFVLDTIVFDYYCY
ncbi:Dabb family protein [Salmonella enterica]|nr:Dabb family protein [Salmonella enterica]ECG5801087.1 Dabb family protein [Salmonella enterica subsp. enterica serovar Muenchen]EDU9608689.1 Dabb family protein [Salmonella enterica subsp. enterica serovar Sandiego]ECQ3651795.1 Dabb family protein [Salmonella enterica]EDV4825269.1 Dabb family protein [Salmonella enterica]